ncbi:hypothetical protein GGX14DRAFT_366794, partial [Mycena pura]
AVLNLSKSATDAEIHERHRTLSLIFHPDKHHNDDDKSLATEKFLEVQKAYEVMRLPPLTSHIRIGEPGLAVNWLEETRTRSSAELQPIFKQVRYQWLQSKADTISPRGRAVCKVDASPLFVPYQGLQDDIWPRRLLNRLEDVRLLSFSLRHNMQKRITERSSVSLATRLSRRGAAGRGNFVGTLRWSTPRLTFEATSALLSPYDMTFRAEYQNEQHDAVSVQTSIVPGMLVSLPPILISVSRKLHRRPDSALGNLKIELGQHPQVAISFVSQDPMEAELNKPHDAYVSLLPLGHTVCASSHGFVLNSFDPKLFGEWGVTFTQLSVQCKLGLECGINGLAWLLSGAWITNHASLAGTVRLSHRGVIFTIDATYLQQRLSVPILLSEQHDSMLALWTAAMPSALCVSLYCLRAKSLRRKRLRYAQLLRGRSFVEPLTGTREIRATLRALEPNSPARRDAEAIISFLRDKARDCLVIVEATYGAIETADRDLGLFWDITIPLQTLVRGSQVYIPGRHPKCSIQGFLDPAPFALKSMRVRYLFRGRMHYAEVPEYLSLVLPLSGEFLDFHFFRTIDNSRLLPN